MSVIWSSLTCGIAIIGRAFILIQTEISPKGIRLVYFFSTRFFSACF